MPLQQPKTPDKSRQRGKVVNFLPRKGYGFIMGDDNVKVFVHYSDIRGSDYKTLVAGEEVEYSVIQGNKGLQATDVYRLNPPQPEELAPILGNNKTW